MTFKELPISSQLKSALSDMGFITPTQIQEEVIPHILQGSDVLAQSPTGTGKTCAFGIPAIEKIDTELKQVQTLILCPTRELAVQIEKELLALLKYSKNIHTVAIYGGQSIEKQVSSLKKNPHIVVGTTGRVMDHMRRKTLKLDNLKMLVLDEVDEMLNMGFKEDIDCIMQSVPNKDIQTVMFSATIPSKIEGISKTYQKNPVRCSVAQSVEDKPLISQFYIETTEQNKLLALAKLLKKEEYTLALVFCSTKKRVEEVTKALSNMGFSADELHGDLRQHQRDRAMERFRTGKTHILVATDVAARGIDVDNIQAVFNFDIPQDEEYYVHRIGRTARANKSGVSYTFVTPKQQFVIGKLEKFTHSPILLTTAENTEVSISKKRFKKTLRLAKRDGLEEYRQYIMEILKEKKETENVELIDIAAAMLMQLSQQETYMEAPNITLSPESSKPTKLLRITRENRTEQTNFNKYFVNIGSKDGVNQAKLTELLTKNTTLTKEDIVEVVVMDSFSFVKVLKESATNILSLDGVNFKNKKIVVDLCTENSSGRSANRKQKPVCRRNSKR